MSLFSPFRDVIWKRVRQEIQETFFLPEQIVASPGYLKCIGNFECPVKAKLDRMQSDAKSFSELPIISPQVMISARIEIRGEDSHLPTIHVVMET